VVWTAWMQSPAFIVRLSNHPTFVILAMPGSSLWFLPPTAHPLDSKLSILIDQISTRFESPHRFLPHVTITSEILASKYLDNPQAWLDSLQIQSVGDVGVKFEKLASEDVKVRKLYIKCEKAEGLKKLAVVCRREVDGFHEEEKATQWAADNYNPHLSLLYHDCPPVGQEKLEQVETLAQKLDVSISGQGGSGGWRGGRVVLVPTDKSIDQWIPIAERTL
jgi:2',3'-cyclic-nucleotide 3'-phosphodiesterase